MPIQPGKRKLLENKVSQPWCNQEVKAVIRDMA